MAKVIFRQEAIDDLNAIWLYTSMEWSEQQADKYYDSLELACAQIGQNPELGKLYGGVRPSLLGLRTGRHIIFYQAVSPVEVEIVRILHERMDLRNRLEP